MNDAETRGERIDPKLKACGWGAVEGFKVLVNTASQQVKFKQAVAWSLRNNHLEKGLEKYFNFYNDERFHESLNYKTPGEKDREKQAA